MNIKAVSDKGVMILEISGGINGHHVAVLRAGIKQFLEHGKNKIILNLIATETLAGDVLLAIARFHEVVAELSGAILLVGQEKQIAEVLAKIPNPPKMHFFSTIGEAQEFFKKGDEKAPSKNASGPKPAAVKPPLDFSQLEKLTDKEIMQILVNLKKENDSLKKQVSVKEIEEMRALYAENSQVAGVLAVMQERFRKGYIRGKKIRTNIDDILRKIAEAEVFFEDYLRGETMLSGSLKNKSDAAPDGASPKSE